MLNFHMGKMIASDRSRSQKARTYLKKAVEKPERINPEDGRRCDQAGGIDRSRKDHPLESWSTASLISAKVAIEPVCQVPRIPVRLRVEFQRVMTVGIVDHLFVG